MLQAIREIKSNSQDSRAQLIFIQACHELSDGTADILLVGCSEFSIINQLVPKGMNYIDTIDELAQAVVDFASDSQTHRQNTNFIHS